ncbi:MAG: hypothetical protein O7G28_01700, partial [Deltaproteobacteria bacterium]|nr:hypothetical protein [Deltaproteobacteria bacterium]
MRIEITSEVRCVLLLPNHVAPRAEGSPDGLEPLRPDGSLLDQAKGLVDRGYSVLTFDLRGHGQS